MDTDELDMSISEWDIITGSLADIKHDEGHVQEIESCETIVEEESSLVPKGASLEDELYEKELLRELELLPELDLYPVKELFLENELYCKKECQFEGSCSSSDIDIIDESVLDDSHNNISIPSIDLSLSSSFETNLSVSLPTLPDSEPIEDLDENITVHFDLPQRNIPMKYIFILFVIGCLGFFMQTPETPVDTIKEMEKRIMTLQKENTELKSNMISKIEDDILLVALEEQISALKGENSKLSKFMKDLINQLEEQTITFKKESQIKGKESYKNEIDKLKEQINILRIDNEELQKQLVRMRYGVYSPRAQDPKIADTGHKQESKEDISESKNENFTELLSEEIKDLRKKLYSEVEKLKNWKDSVQHLMKELENRPKEFPESDGKESSDKEKSEGEGEKLTQKKMNKKNRYEGILKDLNGHLSGAINQIPQFNITDLVMRYMGVDKKKVKDVFESVSHYFKKAQEKTKDIFDENMKNDMWNYIGGLRKQWHLMKKAYFSKHPKKAQSPDEADYKPHFTEGHAEKSHPSETGNKKNYKHQNNPEMERKEKQTTHPLSSDEKGELKNKPNARIPENSKWHANKKFEIPPEATASMNSWVFERAAHRSELREHEEEVNWFLKKRKEEEALKHKVEENEQEKDPYENIDMFAFD